jgi:hypothetical protein
MPKNCRLITPTKLMVEIIGQNLQNPCAIRRTLLAEKDVKFCTQKICAKTMMKSTPAAIL